MENVFPRHALDQLQERNITIQQVKEVLQNPQQIRREANYTIMQSVLKFEDEDYLLQVFLNDLVSPHRVTTVYKTSKIDKYHEGEI